MSEDYSLGTYSKLAETAEKKQQPVPPAPIAQPRTQNVHDETKQATTTPRNHATTVSRPHDTTADSGDDYIEVVRKAVKLLGEKAATHRFTADEKDAIADIVYALKKKGITTSENEITRIAINYLVWEYRQSKQISILSRVLERLNA
jgi:septal ring-binding cell division protein DamX